MTDWRKTTIPPTATIRQTIESIDSSARQIALVVDEKDVLLGTVTDGDIRRGILRGVDLEEAVSRVMQTRPRTIGREVGREGALRRMQEAGIKQLPRVDDQGRVLGLETLGDLLAPEPVANGVVLMVGGLGTRLRPLTNDVPKPLLEVGGRPLLQTIIENFRRQGFRHFTLCVNHMADQFEAFFGDGSRHGVETHYVYEPRKLGTAGALSLLPPPQAPVIVMNGDLLTAVDYRHLLDFHRLSGAAATMAVRDYTFEVPFGVAQIEGDRLLAISEKPEQHFFVNAGLYVLEPEAVARVPKDQPYDMPTLFSELIEKGRGTAVFPLREYWLDVGRLDDLERARGEFEEVFGGEEP